MATPLRSRIIPATLSETLMLPTLSVFLGLDDHTWLQASTSKNAHSAMTYAQSRPSTLSICHARIGHLGKGALQLLASRGMLNGLNSTSAKFGNISSCNACLTSKTTRRSFPSLRSPAALENAELVHSDICGPMRTPSYGVFEYFMLVIDDKTGMTFVYILKRNREACFPLQMLRSKTAHAIQVAGPETEDWPRAEYCGNHFTKQVLTVASILVHVK